MATPDYTYLFSPGLDGSSFHQAGATPRPQTEGGQTPAATAAKPTANGFDFNDYASHGLDPTLFSQSVTFQMPAFLAQGGIGQFTDGPTYLEPDMSRYRPQESAVLPPPKLSRHSSSANIAPLATTTLPLHSPLPKQVHQQKVVPYNLDPSNPVYGPYGSSVIELNPDLAPFPKTNENRNSNNGQPTPSMSVDDNEPEFDPNAPGLPRALGGNFPGLYSSSGFDMVGVLARVAARPNPQIHVGPIDTSTSFIVVDARRYDFPIVFASDTFTKLTGYNNEDVIGRNCRFLQSPTGQVTVGAKRRHTDSSAVYHMKSHILAGKETQTSLLNYRKDGTPFVNLVTVIPISWDTDEIAYFVGLQVDLVDQPNAILAKMQNGTYTVNYTLIANANLNTGKAEKRPEASTSAVKAVESPVQMQAAQNGLSAMALDPVEVPVINKQWAPVMLENSHDMIFVLSQRGKIRYSSLSFQRATKTSTANGLSILDYIHPDDTEAFTKSLARMTGPDIVSVIFRLKRGEDGFGYVEAQGRLYSDDSKSKRAIIFTARERPTPKLSLSLVHASGGFGQVEFWSRLSEEGLYLHVGQEIKQVAGFQPNEVCGLKIFQLTKPEAATEIKAAIQKAKEGAVAGTRVQFKTRKGGWIDAFCTFYPAASSCPNEEEGSSVKPVYAPSSRPGHPLSILCQTNTFESEVRRQAQKGKQVEGARSSGNLFQALECEAATDWQTERGRLVKLNKQLRKQAREMETALKKHRPRPETDYDENPPKTPRLGGAGICPTCSQSVTGGKGPFCHDCAANAFGQDSFRNGLEDSDGDSEGNESSNDEDMDETGYLPVDSRLQF